MKNNLSSADLSVSGKLNRAGSVACRKSHKSVSYQTATEWRDEKIDMRIKYELIEGNYQPPYRDNTSVNRYECSKNLSRHKRSKRLKDGSRIRQSIMPTVTM